MSALNSFAHAEFLKRNLSHSEIDSRNLSSDVHLLCCDNSVNKTQRMPSLKSEVAILAGISEQTYKT